MRKFVVLAGLLSVCLSSASTPARAQGMSEEKAAKSSFEELKRELKPTLITSAAQIRANLEALNGSAVEVQGEVSGLLTREGVKIVMLRIADDMTLLASTLEKNNAALRAGAVVRVIARVDAARKDAPLVVLAVGNGTRAEPVMATLEDGATIVANADVALPPAQAVAQTSPKPKPQPKPLAARGGSTAPAKAAPKPAAKPATSTTALATPIAASGFDLEELVGEQKPAYEALIRRHNKKLKGHVVSEIAEALLRAGYKYTMDPRFLAAIIAVESDFDVHCVSSSGAMGLGQLMPFNLKEAGVSNPWNPTQNVFGTAKLLRGHLDDYKNRKDGTLLAVAAYNAGPGAVRRAGYKVPKGAQVQRYVWKVYYRYKAFAPDMF